MKSNTKYQPENSTDPGHFTDPEDIVLFPQKPGCKGWHLANAYIDYVCGREVRPPLGQDSSGPEGGQQVPVQVGANGPPSLLPVDVDFVVRLLDQQPYLLDDDLQIKLFGFKYQRYDLPELVYWADYSGRVVQEARRRITVSPV